MNYYLEFRAKLIQISKQHKDFLYNHEMERFIFKKSKLSVIQIITTKISQYS